MPCCWSSALGVAPRVVPLAGRPDREGARQHEHRGEPERHVLARRPAPHQRDLEPDRGQELAPRTPRCRRARAAARCPPRRCTAIPATTATAKTTARKRRAAARGTASGRRRGRSPTRANMLSRSRCPPRSLWVACIAMLPGRAARRARRMPSARPGCAPRVSPRRARSPAYQATASPATTKREVAPRVGRLADPPGAGRLAEAVAAADVGAEPAPARGGHDEGQ